MTRSIFRFFGRILVNIHLIVFVGFLAGFDRIIEGVGFEDWQVGLAAVGVFVEVFLLRCLILSKYVTGRWGFRALNDFYSEDRANRFYEPWDQRRLFNER